MDDGGLLLEAFLSLPVGPLHVEVCLAQALLKVLVPRGVRQVHPLPRPLAELPDGLLIPLADEFGDLNVALFQRLIHVSKIDVRDRRKYRRTQAVIAIQAAWRGYWARQCLLAGKQELERQAQVIFRKVSCYIPRFDRQTSSYQVRSATMTFVMAIDGAIAVSVHSCTSRRVLPPHILPLVRNPSARASSDQTAELDGLRDVGEPRAD
eukprot:COSAG04_NODE_449_length_14207_cov_16.131840_4_plen_208_part_00